MTLILLRWPLTFFGKSCFPIYKHSLKDFLGTGRDQSEDRDFAGTIIESWPTKRVNIPQQLSELSHASYDMTEYQIATEQMHPLDQRSPRDVFLFHRGRAVGEYGKNSIVIDPEHRRKNLSTILILAKATIINGFPNPTRSYTIHGRRAMLSAYHWICRMRDEKAPNER